MASQKIYDMVTERIVQKLNDAIAAIENGEIGIAPWKRSWYQAGIPQNLVSKKAYRGMNVFMLSALGYAQPWFVTSLQATELHIDFDHWGKYRGRKAGFDKKGNLIKAINKGEKGCPIVFWKKIMVDKDTNGQPLDKPKAVMFLRYSTGFNVEQCNGLDHRGPELPTREFNPIAEGEAIIANMPNRPKMEDKQARAFYRPSDDMVNMPRKELFDSDEAYYAVAFHELVHSTGHTSRLDRSEVMDANIFGSHDYSVEELVAEMGAVYLCNEIGIESTEDNSLAYLKGWLKSFKSDTKMLVVASGRAQKAADYILDRQPDYPKNDDD